MSTPGDAAHGNPAQAYQRLRSHLAYLKLSAATEALPAQLETARANSESHTVFYQRLLGLEVAATLCAEVDDRAEGRRHRLVHEARFPRLERLDGFDTGCCPVGPETIATLADSSWIEAGHPLGAVGGLGHREVPPAHRDRHGRPRSGPQGPLHDRRAGLVNELVEADDDRALSRAVARYARPDLLLVDELGYLHLDERGAELLFQVITAREERVSIAIATNAPFSEWGHTFTDPRPSRRRGRPADLQRPHHRDRHRLLPAAYNPRHHHERARS